jgi:peptide/nickel transport system substrate-binding protein
MTSPLEQRTRLTTRSFVNRVFGFIEARKPFDRVLIKASLLMFFVALGFTLYYVNERYLETVPNDGGVLTEGIVGTPRFVNPVLAVTPADKDLVALVYAGLMRLGPNGDIVSDMAESITMSEDGLTYSVVLKNGFTFHDGAPVTADDVIFTISRLQDPALKSPLLANWEGVVTERVSDRELNIILAKPYGPFLENLTVGILPRHIWEDASADAFPFSQYNSEPIGSGPYKVKRIVRSKSGIPESYILEPFSNTARSTPRIENLTLAFYSNEKALIEAWNQGAIGSVAGLSSASIEQLGDIQATHKVLTAPLPRTFAVFFNQNEAPLFRDSAVRTVLSMVTDKTALVEQVLLGGAYPITGPIPPTSANTTEAIPAITEETIDRAREVLRDGGWKFDEASGRWKKKLNDIDTELAFTLTTANSETLRATAAALKEQWERVGVAVTVEQYEQVDLTQSIIRPRKFDALLFGTVIGRKNDLYPFWHSSQRTDPGLNIALYANIVTDALLAEARANPSREERNAKNMEFATELAKDTPAIFLYAPSYTYVLPARVQNAQMVGIAEPFERFANVNEWYIDTEAVWPLFK